MDLLNYGYIAVWVYDCIGILNISFLEYGYIGIQVYLNMGMLEYGYIRVWILEYILWIYQSMDILKYVIRLGGLEYEYQSIKVEFMKSEVWGMWIKVWGLMYEVLVWRLK